MDDESILKEFPIQFNSISNKYHLEMFFLPVSTHSFSVWFQCYMIYAHTHIGLFFQFKSWSPLIFIEVEIGSIWLFANVYWSRSKIVWGHNFEITFCLDCEENQKPEPETIMIVESYFYLFIYFFHFFAKR